VRAIKSAITNPMIYRISCTCSLPIPQPTPGCKCQTQRAARIGPESSKYSDGPGSLAVRRHLDRPIHRSGCSAPCEAEQQGSEK
jgi:hypothetical protein